MKTLLIAAVLYSTTISLSVVPSLYGQTRIPCAVDRAGYRWPQLLLALGWRPPKAKMLRRGWLVIEPNGDWKMTGWSFEYTESECNAPVVLLWAPSSHTFFAGWPIEELAKISDPNAKPIR